MAQYDSIAEEYAASLQDDDPASIHHIALTTVLELLGDVKGLRVCDVACGEGILSRQLAARGALVTGVDLSRKLLAIARQNSPATITFRHDDVQTLATCPTAAFDRVACNLALMDIPNLAASYRAIHRVLAPGGQLVFSITHPCFQAPGTHILLDDTGEPSGRAILRYATEGIWYSSNTAGIRGKVGAYHRTLSTYVVQALDTGFALQAIVEPLSPPVNQPSPHQRIGSEIPSVMAMQWLRV